ncbi:MAG TPA: DNA-processing protein DprA [Bacteroidia bacterium]|nr:DNA-processing protein DprA [Bacteroidia bacterium]
MEEEKKHQIALTFLPHVGGSRAKVLIAYCGSAEAVFKEKKSNFIKIPGIGELVVDSIFKKDSLKNSLVKADKEIIFIEKNKITPISFLDDAFPKRLKHCQDSPIMLYYKGIADLNTAKVLSIVGTRKATDYGKKICEEFVQELAAYNVLIVSGLAYGIDAYAHKAALANNLETVGVFAHGLDRIYPAIHKNIADKMILQGGLLTEFPSETIPNRENFPSRNRIVAGMADAVLVIESAKGGGSLITADLATTYNRDVFAVPGRINDTFSEGCNFLIRNNKAALAQSAKDILYVMGWEEKLTKKNPKQAKLFAELSKEETMLVNILKEKSLAIDDICFITQMTMSKTSALLLQLEFSGVIKSLPGKRYAMN